MLTQEDAETIAKDMLGVRNAELERLNVIHDYLTAKTCKVYVPKSAGREYRELVSQSRVNVLPMVVSAFSSNLFAEGYRGDKEATDAQAWDIWQANRMDARQSGIYRSAIGYGLSYAVVLPGKVRGNKSAVIMPYSPRLLSAVYADPVNDEWPVYAIAVSVGYDAERRKPVRRTDLYDETTRYRFESYGEDDTLHPVGVENHGLGVTPVVRWLNEYGDIEDGSQGVVQPLIPFQDQLNNTTFGLLMAQQYAAFKQRWVSGMAIAEDENGSPVEPFNAAVNRMFHAESPDTKFGEFAETNLNGYLDSRQSTLRIMSAVGQIPPHALLVSDGVSNLNAEALAALEASHQRRVMEYKTSFGESDEQMLRLASKAAGDEKGWEDTSAQMMWRDTESRSLAQIADAYGKFSQMLAIPPQGLWDKLPGFSRQDVEGWKKLASQEDGLEDEEATPDGAQPLADARP